MATKSISQLDTQATANETDLFEVAIVDANSASGYASKKESAAAIADAIVGEYQYPLRITGTTAKTISGAINEIAGEVADLKDLEGSASGDIATFGDGSDNPLKALTISIVATQSGSGDPSPTNVRPISGFNAVNVGDISDAEKVQYFKGLLDGTYDFVDLGSLNWGYYDNTFFTDSLTNKKVITNYIVETLLCSQYPTVSNSYTTSTMPDPSIKGQTNSVRVLVKDTSYTSASEFKTAMSGVYLIYELATPTTPTITTTEFNTLVSAFGLQGWLVKIAMPTETGTVGGGNVDIVNGEIMVNKVGIKGVTVARIGTSSASVRYVDTTPIYDNLVENTPTISDRYKQINTSATAISGQFRVYNGVFTIYDDRFTDLDTAQSLLNDVEFYYELATPATHQLTPTEIRSLLGVNNVWADCGAITELKYTRDLNLCINDIIARIEALEGASNTRSLSLSPTLTKSLTSDSDTTEGKTEETEEETKEEAQKNER